MNYELWGLMNPYNGTVPNQDYFDACQEYRLGKQQDERIKARSIEMADANNMFIRDEKRGDWKNLTPERRKEIINEVMDTARDSQHCYEMNVLFQVMQDFEERIRHLEGWRDPK